MGGEVQGELLPAEPEAEVEEETLEPPDPVVEALLANLANIEKESRSSLERLQQGGGTDFKVSTCTCAPCIAIAPVVAAIQDKAAQCSCRLCLVAHEGGDQGHSGSCACKLCNAARCSIRAAQQMRGIIENEW